MDIRSRLEAKLRRNRAAILTNDEVKACVAEARRILVPELAILADGDRVGFENHVRWGAMKARCERAREELGCDLKSAAAATNMPRYRLHAIEMGYLPEFRPELAWRYFGFLGIAAWVKRWVRANPELAERSGIAPPRSKLARYDRTPEPGNLTTRCSGRTRVARPVQKERTGRATRRAAERER